jgi:predicted RecA/RadA family phage recombinase
MTNKVQEGQIIEYANSGSAISSGDVVVLGDRVGIAITDISATTGKGSVDLCGVYSASKDGDEAFDQGDMLYYDSSDSTFTKTAPGNTPAGIAFEDAAEASTSCKVQLCPHPKRAANIAALTGGESPTEAEFNALLTALKNAGLMKNA